MPLNRLPRALMLASAAWHVAALASPLAAQRPDAEVFSGGRQRDRAIAQGESHRYRFAVAKGQLFRATIDQRGVDVALSLVASSGRVLAECNERADAPSAPAMLSFIARAADTLTIRVRATALRFRPGTYHLAVDAARLATDADEQSLRAERLFHRARAMHGQSSDSLSEALRGYQGALRIWRANGDAAWAARTLVLAASAQSALNQFDSAQVALDTALAMHRAGAGDSLGVADALNVMADVAYRRGDSPAALERAALASRVARFANDAVREAWALKLVGQAHLSMGNADGALAHLDSALKLFRARDHRAGEGATLDRLAAAYHALGRYEAALDAYASALVASRAARDADLQMSILNNRALVLTDLGRPREALADYRRALTIAVAQKKPRSQATLLSNMAALEAGTNPRRAREQYLRALALRESLVDRLAQAATLNNLANLYVKAFHDDRQALGYLDRSVALLKSIPDPVHEAIVLATVASIQARTDMALARHTFDQSLALTRAAEGDPRDEATTLRMMARAENDRGDPFVARRLLAQSLALSEAVRRSVSAAGFRASVTALFQPDVQLYIDVLMRLHRAMPDSGFAVQAFEAAEGARARGLLDALPEVRIALGRELAAGLRAEEQAIQKRLAAAIRRRSAARSSSDSTRYGAVDRDLDSLLLASDELRARIRRANPRYADVADAVPFATPVLQRELLADPAAVLLEFVVGDRSSWLFSVTRDSVAAYELPSRATIDSLVRLYYASVTARNVRAPDETQPQLRQRLAAADRVTALLGARLSRILLAPAAGLTGNRRIYIAAQGSLEFLPFAALPEPRALHSSNPAPLMLAHEVVNVPSASAAVLLRRRRSERGPLANRVAAIADPVHTASDLRVHAPAGATLATANPDGLGSLPRLAYARAESEALLGLVPSSQRTRAFDFDASIGVLETLQNYSILHLGIHAIQNDVRPELSGLVLSMVTADGRPVDGLLSVARIHSMSLPSGLVVLAACSTAIGPELRGEGPVSLGRAFLFAGAQGVLNSLWDVSDKGTSEFMRRFYDGLLTRRLSPAAALRQAQLALWRDGRTGEPPYLWAAFAIQGEGR